MSLTAFSDIPGSATLWIIGSLEPFTGEQVRALREHMPKFIEEWTAHGKDVQAGWDILHNRFIVIGINENLTALTGCSQDTMRENIRQFARATEAHVILGSSHVFYLDASGEIQCVTRPEFKKLAAGGAVHEETIVFDTTIDNLQDFRQGKWEIPMKRSWHSKAFGAVTSAS